MSVYALKTIPAREAAPFFLGAKASEKLLLMPLHDAAALRMCAAQAHPTQDTVATWQVRADRIPHGQQAAWAA